MNLRSKKELAARTLGVGKGRIIFVEARKDEIKEMITKQDARDLAGSGAILIKPVKGRKKSEGGKKSRGVGKVKKTINKRKKEYAAITKKLRRYTKELMNSGKINKDKFMEIRKNIRNNMFKSRSGLQKYAEELKQ